MDEEGSTRPLVWVFHLPLEDDTHRFSFPSQLKGMAPVLGGECEPDTFRFVSFLGISSDID